MLKRPVRLTKRQLATRRFSAHASIAKLASSFEAGAIGCAAIFDELHAEGRQAALAGTPVRACPYDPKVIPRISMCWINGWLDRPALGWSKIIAPRDGFWILLARLRRSASEVVE
jgi:ribosome modulation factor